MHTILCTVLQLRQKGNQNVCMDGINRSQNLIRFFKVHVNELMADRFTVLEVIE